MARSAAAGQVSANQEKRFARCRMAMMTAVLAVTLALFAEPHQASAQYTPLGPPQQQPPYPTYAPYPSAAPAPGQVAEPGVKRRVERAAAQRRTGRLYRKPRELAPRRRTAVERRNVPDQLVATVYMVSIKDIDDHKALDAGGVSGPVNHVSFYHNPGHPGMDTPHYHFVI